MRSSIFSSEWAKTWALAIALMLGSLAVWECVLRANGHRPMAVDSPALWSYWRDQAGGDKVVVVLGDSRPQLGWSNEACEQTLPGYHAVQLAVGGLSSPVAVLRDLADDPQFHGILIVCVSECSFDPSLWELQASYVAAYHLKWHLNDRLNLLASCAFHNELSMLHPTLKLDQLIIHAANYATLPSPFYLYTWVNRNSRSDYSRVDLTELRRKAIQYSAKNGPSTSPEKWVANALTAEPYVDAIQKRGGRVVYVRFPTDGELWEIDERAYPKCQYWDALAASTNAMCIHFRDYPSLQFPCPDYSHIDGKDAPAFTKALIRVIVDGQVGKGT